MTSLGRRLADPLGVKALRTSLTEMQGTLAAQAERQRTHRRRAMQMMRGVRANLISARNYAAGVADNLTADWTTYPSSIDEVLQQQLRTLVARSRDQCRRNPYCRKFKRLVGSNAVGQPGITLRAKFRNADGTSDEVANRVVEEAWREFTHSKFCDFERRLNYIQMQRLVAKTMAQDGEVFSRRIYENPEVNPWGISWQLLDSQLVDVDHRSDLPGGAYIRMGIQFSPSRQREGYWFWDQRGSDPSGGFYNLRRAFIGADEIKHLFLAEDTAQTRGVPWTATALYFLKMHGAYSEAALIACRIGAVRGGFFESEYGDEDDLEGDEVDAETGLETEELSPDAPFRKLPPGMKFSSFIPDYPRGEFPDFNKAMLRGIAAGLGPSYHSLANDMESVNFSTARFGRQEEMDFWTELQDDLASDMCTPDYRDWLRMQLLLGTLRVGDAPLRADLARKYQRIRWQGRTWSPIKPTEDSTANEKDCQNRFRSISSVIRERGEDPDEVAEEIKGDEKLGLVPAPKAAAPMAPPDQPEPEDESSQPKK